MLVWRSKRAAFVVSGAGMYDGSRFWLFYQQLKSLSLLRPPVHTALVRLRIIALLVLKCEPHLGLQLRVQPALQQPDECKQLGAASGGLGAAVFTETNQA
jgi:hypothetical protein